MRLIDADALFERAYEIWGIEADASDTNIFMQAINDAPTIDAVEITRCKDCVSYGITTNGGYPRSYDCGVNGPNDFCSHALDKAYFEQEGEDDENE